MKKLAWCYLIAVISVVLHGLYYLFAAHPDVFIIVLKSLGVTAVIILLAVAITIIQE